MAYIENDAICEKCGKKFDACHLQTFHGNLQDKYCPECDILIEQDAFKAWIDRNFPRRSIEEIIKYLWTKKL